MEPPRFVAGVVLAGGRSSRMGGSDKCLAPLAGKPVVAHVIARLQPQVATLALNANAEPSRFASFGLPIIADRIEGHAGPLAGLHAALAWARECGANIRHVVTVACDTPFLPDDLVERFLAALEETGRGMLRGALGRRRAPGDWAMADWDCRKLEAALDPGQRKASAWAEQQGAVEVFFPPTQLGGRAIDPFFNINRPEDLAEANAFLAATPSSGVDATDLRAFQRQIVHQALLIEDEADHRAHDLVGVDRAADPHGDDGHRAVDADLPSGPLLEPVPGHPAS